MHGLDHRGAGVRRLEHREAWIGGERGTDRLGPAGVLERHLQCRRLDLVLGVVPTMTVRGEDPDHAVNSGLEHLFQVLLPAQRPLQLARRRLRQRARLHEHHVTWRQPAHVERAVVDGLAHGVQVDRIAVRRLTSATTTTLSLPL